MPYSLVLHCLSPRNALTPEDLQGQKALALFLEELIQKQDTALATRLHAPRQSKPFTTAIVHPLGSHTATPKRASAAGPRPGSSSAPDHEVKIRLTLLDDALYPLISRFFLQHPGGTPLLRLGKTPLTVSAVSTTPASGEPWAGMAGFDDLLSQASPDDHAWSLRFATPTAFKSGEAELPLPIPRLCFQSWLNSWDAHSPRPFFDDRARRRAFLEEVVEGNVSVTYGSLHLRTQDLYFDGRRMRDQGFVGTCRLSAKPAHVAPEARRLLAALVAYSFFSGTGRKTTMGMGVTQPLSANGVS
jgi:CRISPR-associated endoribonuclease Cas6